VRAPAAGEVLGVDFAAGMIDLARRNAEEAGIGGVCRFLVGDFLAHRFDRSYDYAIVIGFMDYVSDPERVVGKVAALTRSRAFFSFPKDGGFLAWQRKLRYRSRCELYLYTEKAVDDLFRGCAAGRYTVESADRDFFVTLHRA